MRTTCSIGVERPGRGGSVNRQSPVAGQATLGPTIWGRRLLASTCVAPAARFSRPGTATSVSVPFMIVLSPGVPLAYGVVPRPFALVTARRPSARTVTDVGYHAVGMRPRSDPLDVS